MKIIRRVPIYRLSTNSSPKTTLFIGQQYLKTGKSVVTVTAQTPDTETKTAIRHDGTTFKFCWLAGDKIQLYEIVYEGSGEEEVKCKSGESDPLEENTDVAQFTVNLEEHEKPEEATYKYIGIYPSIRGNYAIWRDDHPTIFAQLPNMQTPAEDSFDPYADLLVSKLIEAKERPENLSLQFARVGGIIKLDLKGLTKGCEIKEGRFVNDEGFATAYMTQVSQVNFKPLGRPQAGQRPASLH